MEDLLAIAERRALEIDDGRVVATVEDRLRTAGAVAVLRLVLSYGTARSVDDALGRLRRAPAPVPSPAGPARAT